MAAFVGVDLNLSRVRRWRSSDAALILEVEGVLQPVHPAYERPRQGSEVCCKPGRLVFPFPREVKGLKEMRAAADAGPSVSPSDFGIIERLSLESDGSYRLSGAFGEVTVQSMAVRFEIVTQKQC
jgi:hypothetical protein